MLAVVCSRRLVESFRERKPSNHGEGYFGGGDAAYLPPIVADLSPHKAWAGQQGLSRDRRATCIWWRFGRLAVEVVVVGVPWARCHRAPPENG